MKDTTRSSLPWYVCTTWPPGASLPLSYMLMTLWFWYQDRELPLHWEKHFCISRIQCLHVAVNSVCNSMLFHDLTEVYMTGVTCEEGNDYSSGTSGGFTSLAVVSGGSCRSLLVRIFPSVLTILCSVYNFDDTSAFHSFGLISFITYTFVGLTLGNVNLDSKVGLPVKRTVHYDFNCVQTNDVTNTQCTWFVWNNR